MAKQRDDPKKNSSSGAVGKVIFAFVTFSLVLIGVKIHSSLQLSPAPVLDEPWWGSGASGKDDTAIKPFKINVSDEVLKDLKDRLNNKRTLTTSLEDAKHNYGINNKLLEEITTYWAKNYDWRQREKFLNKFPQYKTQIQGLDIHYLHVKPTNAQGKKVLPLLMLHGWPGSVREFYEIIPLLTTPQKEHNFVFEVIIPSLPGYGFSQAASKKGLGAAQISVVFKNLMERLGYKKYYIQGGDWGSVIVAIMSQLFEDRILGVHSNICLSRTKMTNLKLLLGSLYPPAVVDKEFEHRLYPLSTFMSNFMLEFGYLHLQATKPDTVGVALNDSPVGLAAYILEKFITWTDPAFKNKCHGGLQVKYNFDDLLDNIMIYWITNSITTSVRLYSETLNQQHYCLELDNVAINVPAACAIYKNELIYQPEGFLRDKYMNLVHTSIQRDGGHFAAFEVPKSLADDIWVAVGKFENLYKKQV